MRAGENFAAAFSISFGIFAYLRGADGRVYSRKFNTDSIKYRPEFEVGAPEEVDIMVDSKRYGYPESGDMREKNYKKFGLGANDAATR